jgi:hypothetical protein
VSADMGLRHSQNVRPISFAQERSRALPLCTSPSGTRPSSQQSSIVRKRYAALVSVREEKISAVASRDVVADVQDPRG